jgi:uncharacterized protein DUF7002
VLEEQFARSRPYLYHLTDRSNLTHIRKTNKLLPAASLMVRAGRDDLLRVRRLRHEKLALGKTVILVRDQAPLHKGNMEMVGGFPFEDFIESINRRIFFWPGTAIGPNSYGVRHFERYQEEHPVLLRIGFGSLLLANPSADPLFCTYNSGAPRCSNGKKSPRGPDTFLSAFEFNATPSQVVEVTFRSELELPPDASFGNQPTGPWNSLH